MKKVLVVGMSPIVGGVNTFILNIFMHLNKKYKFEFINTYNKPLVNSKLIKANGGIIRHINIPQNILKYFVRCHCIKDFFKKHHDYDIIDVNTSTINKIFWIKIAKKYGVKHCFIHSHIDSSNKPKWLKHILKYLVIYNQHYLWNHPNITKLAASKKCGIWMFGKGTSFKVISNGVNTVKFCYNEHNKILMQNKLGIKSNTLVVISTSRLEPVKNYSKIIRVFYHIHKSIKSSILVILGEGSQYNKIKRLVISLNLVHNVYFLGNKSRNKIPKYLDIANVMIMPSFYEGLPFSIIEAQSSGVPVIASLDIPKSANITHYVKYLSINESDYKWAKMAINISNQVDSSIRLKMNSHVQYSKFNLNNVISLINKLYKK